MSICEIRGFYTELKYLLKIKVELKRKFRLIYTKIFLNLGNYLDPTPGELNWTPT
ncbi:hypothetical protein Cabys_1610 [Caldithrix abyssi DSM 13497]|uniref:Uncharacterized protein n=1 Tax=Caldithrix abyssi DSM 13497 TaxID=880073 RepID=A0A1J1C6T7_CALAY|nr:hypothetical protein Cabys_1610 [Caldithrix abyssi DSM 13497]